MPRRGAGGGNLARRGRPLRTGPKLRVASEQDSGIETIGPRLYGEVSATFPLEGYTTFRYGAVHAQHGEVLIEQDDLTPIQLSRQPFWAVHTDYGRFTTLGKGFHSVVSKIQHSSLILLRCQHRLQARPRRHQPMPAECRGNEDTGTSNTFHGCL